ncbi:MAG: tetratricopeptide repeat protein [Candidatus Hydrogenedentota bacterium]
MDLSGLKWPLVIVVLIAIAWLGSSGGVNWMISNATAATPGADAAQDEKDEARLTKIGGYLMMLWRYEKASQVFYTAMDRYGVEGENYYYNLYRLAKCEEKLDNYGGARNMLQKLIAQEAWTHDDRVPGFDNLNLRQQKLTELHELPQ